MQKMFFVFPSRILRFSRTLIFIFHNKKGKRASPFVLIRHIQTLLPELHSQ